MPWRGPEYPGEFPSLGWDIYEWAVENFAVPDGPLAGEPFDLTDEQLRLLVRFYGLDDRGRSLYRRGAVRRPQGWGKSPLLALVALAELAGPVRFGGWDEDGEPIGVRPTAPWVQIAAVSEDQTDNTYAACYEMAKESPLAGSVFDVGLTRIFLADGSGRLEPVTSAAGTRLGQRITFVVLDETHLWTERNGGRKLGATLRRNASKLGGRSFETTNAHRPGEGSVAELTYQAAQKAAPGLLYDATEVPKVDDLSDREAVMGALRVAYGDSVQTETGGWVDIERLANEIADPSTDPDDARRFYFNQLVSGRDDFVDHRRWVELVDVFDVPLGARVALGFDGSISDDSTVLWGCWDRKLFKVATWDRPKGVKEWRVPRLEVEDAMVDTFARYDVGQMWCDPPLWRTEIDTWADRWGDEVVLELATNQARRFAPLCDRFATAVREGTLHHDGDPLLTEHLAASSRKPVRLSDDLNDGRSQFVIVKKDTRKIDAAVGAVLALGAFEAMPEPEERTPLEPVVIVT